MVAPVIEYNSSKHSGSSGIPTQLNVLHSGECPLRAGFAQSLTEWANVPLSQGGPEASWHYFVDPIAIAHMVNDNYMAWHASEANPMSNGFEQSGYARYSRDEWTTPDGLVQLDNLAWIMAQTALRDGIPMVWLTTEQVEAVTKYGNRSIKGFCTHRQIDPETRTDPGDGYPFDLLTDRVNYYMGGNAPQETEDMANVSDNQLQRLIDAADRIMGVVPNSQVLTVNDIPKIADGILVRPVQMIDPTTQTRNFTGETTLQKKIAWMAYEHRVLENNAAAANAKIDALIGAVASIGTSGITKEEILAQLDKSVQETLGEYKPTFIREGE